MSHAAMANEDAKGSIPRAAILEAITRCESVCNPALIDKRRFVALHQFSGLIFITPHLAKCGDAIRPLVDGPGTAERDQH